MQRADHHTERHAKGLVVISMWLLAALARAGWADPAPATSTAPAAVDKSQFTLLNPVPADQLRGMDTDRPNVTNTPHTIDAGHLQIETGLIDYSYNRMRVAGNTVRSDDIAIGQVNFRLGVLNNLELNAVINPWQIDRTHDGGDNSTAYASGFGDTTLGAKLNLFGAEGGDAVWASALAIQPQFKIATADEQIGNGHFEFAIDFPFLMNLPAGFHLGLQPGVSMERDSSNQANVAGMQNSVSLDRVVVGNLDIYVEYASDVTNERHAKAIQTIDVGGTYPLTDNIVIDTGAAFGLNHATNSAEILAGVSIRF